MTMKTYLLFQLIKIFCAYFVVTIGLPGLVVHKKLKGKPFVERILFYFLIGNFYTMNLVFVLQLLHISHPVTLILGVLIPCAVLNYKWNDFSLKNWAKEAAKCFQQVVSGRMGIKTLFQHGVKKISHLIVLLRKKYHKIPLVNLLEFFCVVLLFASIAFIYGTQILSVYGYSLSDLPVHNYWINALNDNQLFVAGIYPEGAHCIIYFLHAVFGFDTYIILSQFAFVQTVCVMFVLLIFLRLCCKNRFLPYLGLLIYIMGNFWDHKTYFRYYSTLPQECGMIFILPAVYYGFCFFREKYQELKEDQKPTASLYCLLGFAMSFSATFMIHFYNTMILGVFCIAMAIGYFAFFIKKAYFLNIVKTCGIGLGIAILPMVIAFVFGTPLQASIGWGMSIIKDSMANDENQIEMDYTPQHSTGQQSDATMGDALLDEGEGTLFPDAGYTISPVVKKKPFSQRLKEKTDAVKTNIHTHVLSENAYPYSGLIFVALFVLFAVGLAAQLRKEYCYGSMLWTVAIYGVFMIILQAAGDLGIPAIMDANRCSIFLAYSIPLILVMALDCILLFPLKAMPDRSKLVLDYVGVGMMLLVAVWMINEDLVREPENPGCMEMNEAVTCLTNIIRTEEDFTWTIISANDELQMGLDHGFHYEILELLREIEPLKENQKKYIPSPKIFVFIEKVPLDYLGGYYAGGMRISAKGAANVVPGKFLNRAAYEGGNRWILMSRMYYWMQEFKNMYPNDVRVYMETDQFVCYEIIQNTYRLFNLAIDYGYNSR